MVYILGRDLDVGNKMGTTATVSGRPCTGVRCVFVCACVRACVCACAYVRACVHACVYVYIIVYVSIHSIHSS